MTGKDKLYAAFLSLSDTLAARFDPSHWNVSARWLATTAELAALGRRQTAWQALPDDNHLASVTNDLIGATHNLTLATDDVSRQNALGLADAALARLDALLGP